MPKKSQINEYSDQVGKLVLTCSLYIVEAKINLVHEPWLLRNVQFWRIRTDLAWLCSCFFLTRIVLMKLVIDGNGCSWHFTRCELGH